MFFDYQMYISIFIFVVVNLAYGIYKGRGMRDFKDYIHGGRSLSTGSLLVTIMATIVGGNYLTGKIANMQKSDGTGFIITVFQTLAFVMVAYWIQHNIFDKLVLYRDCLTLSQVLGRIYGSTARINSAYISLFFSFMILATQLYSFGFVCEKFGGNYYLSILFLGSIAIFYTMSGGLRAVSATDFLQFTFFISGLLFIVAIIIQKDGMSRISADFYSYIKDLSFTRINVSFTYFEFLKSYFYASILFSPTIIQRFLAVNNPHQNKRTIFVFSSLYPLLRLLLAFIGLELAFHKKYETGAMGAIFDMSSFLLMKFSYGNNLLVLMFMSIVLSTVDSLLNTSVAGIINDFKIQSSLKKVRLLTFLLGICAMVLAFFFKTIKKYTYLDPYTLTVIAMIVGGQLIVPLLFGIYGWSGNNRIYNNSLIGYYVGLILASLGFYSFRNYEVSSYAYKMNFFFCAIGDLPIFFLPAVFFTSFVYIVSHYYHYGKITFVPVKNFVYNPGYQEERKNRPGFLSFFFQPKNTSVFNVRKNKMRPTLFGFVMLINYIIMVLIFRLNTIDHEIYFLFVRMLGLFFCVLLMLNTHWQQPFKSYFPLFWIIALGYNLIFYPTLYMLYYFENRLIFVWFVMSFILFYSFVEPAIFFSVTSFYGVLSCIFYYFTKGFFPFSTLDVMEMLFVFIIVLAFCQFFVNQKKEDDNRQLARNKGWATGFAHDLRNTFQEMLYEIVEVRHEKSMINQVKKKITDRKSKEQILLQFNKAEKIFNDIIAQCDFFQILVRDDLDSVIKKETISVTEQINYFHRLLPSSSQEKISILRGKDFKILFNKKMLDTIVSNLIWNSFKRGNASKVFISWDIKSRAIHIEDNGKGISEEEAPYVFDWHYTTNGTGIGLPLIKETIELFDGKIEFTRLKEGIRFTLYFL